MKRREFISLVGSAAAWPVVARAQQSGGMKRIGILFTTKEDDRQGIERLAAFEQALAGAGWQNGRNIQIDVRFGASDAERIPLLAAEMVGLKPDVIMATTTPMVAALQRATTTIPIIFAFVSDPVGSGFVNSLARPGGNLSGFVNFEASLVSKWLELLREVAPGTRRVAALFNPLTSNGGYYLHTLQTAAGAAGMPATVAEVHNDVEVDRAIAKLQGDGGLLVMPDGFTSAHRLVIIAKAAQYRVPAIYPYDNMAMDGGLIAYGANGLDFYRSAAAYVARVLRGEKPADLPTQQPTKFDFIVNLRTAKTLGLSIPETFLIRADQVIE